MELLPRSDLTIVVQDGTVIAQGPYYELMESNPEFSTLINNVLSQHEQSMASPNGGTSGTNGSSGRGGKGGGRGGRGGGGRGGGRGGEIEDSKPEKNGMLFFLSISAFIHFYLGAEVSGEKKKEEGDGKKLMTKENQQFGGVTAGIYLRYFKATGGYLFVALVLFSFGADITARTLADWYD